MKRKEKKKKTNSLFPVRRIKSFQILPNSLSLDKTPKRYQKSLPRLYFYLINYSLIFMVSEK